jgi:hypothetical protein
MISHKKLCFTIPYMLGMLSRLKLTHSSVMDNTPSSSSVLSPAKKSAYDKETERLDKHGRRIDTVSTILKAILRVLTFLLQLVNHIFR